RSGAGKLQIATCRSIAPHVAVAVPEARVFALPETPSGAIDPRAAAELAERANNADAFLIGPGMIEEALTGALLEQCLPHIDGTVLVLDAIALSCGADLKRLLSNGTPAILTPHAGEIATMLKLDKAEVEAN